MLTRSVSHAITRQEIQDRNKLNNMEVCCLLESGNMIGYSSETKRRSPGYGTRTEPEDISW
jgi:hypothetical protein